MAAQQREQARRAEAQEINDLAADLANLQKLEMQRVKPNEAEDEQLLEGLNELNSKEKEELEEKRANFTPRGAARSEEANQS